MLSSSNRRTFLKTTGTAGVFGLAGCLSSLQGGGGPIPMGSLLPVTGAGESFGGGEQDAVNMAAEQVNAGGGPLGRELDVTNRDSESRVEAATPKYRAMVNEDGIIGFVGAAFSGVSVAIAENLVDDGVMQISPASTSATLAGMGWAGEEGNSPKYFARTAPNDVQQAIVMARVLNSDEYLGADSAAFIFRSDPYGEGLASAASEQFEGESLNMASFSTDQGDFTSTLDSIDASNPDAVLLVAAAGPGSTILSQAHQRGYDWDWVVSEGLDTPEFFETMDPAAIEGMYISSASPQTTQAYQDYIADNGSDALFAPNAYDGLMLLALAVERAGEATGQAIAENIRAVSRPDGETVTYNEFERARDILGDGGEINYEGVSSSVDLNANYEPFTQFAIKQVSNGEAEVIETLPPSWFEGKV